MKDIDKTKVQLINELVELRQRITELGASETKRKQAEERIRHLNTVLHAIRNVNQLITKEKDREKLLKGSCDNLVETRGYSNAWIALLDESGKLVAHAECGLGKSFLPMVERLKRGELTACGQRVLKQSEVVVTEDPVSTCTDCPLSSNYAGRSAAVVRLEYGEKVYGFLSVSAPSEMATDEEELGLFHDVATDIAFVLRSLELEEERKRAEEVLQESRRFLQSIFDGIQDGISVLDGDLNIVSTNRWIEKMYAPQMPLVGKKCYSAYQGRETPCPWCPSIPTLKTGEVHNREVPYPTEQDPAGWIGLSAFPLKDADGRVSGIIEHAKDITERKQAEEALRQSEERYRTILDEMQDSYFEVDLAGNYTFVNDANCRAFGYSRQEMLGMDYRAVMVEKDTATIYQDFNEVYRTGKPKKALPYQFVRKDGSTGFGELSISPLRDRQGEIIGFRGIGRDITERVQIEGERRELERKAHLASRLASVGEMASGIAHEINNPLTGVIGYAQLLIERDIPQDIKADLQVIHDGAQRVAGIVKRLLTFAGQQKPGLEYVNINDIIETTLALRTYELETSNIKVATYLDPQLPQTIGDGGQLQQVFLNLMINAEAEMKLAHGKGNLLIKTETVDNIIRISFEDDGPGMKKETLERIFEPFFTTREVGQGTGLGLSVCHGIVAEHGGTITVESQLRKGATFIVELPLVTKAEQLKLAEPDAEESVSAAGGRILVVDDEPTILSFLSEALTDEGYEVETVDNASDALEKVKNERYSLILLDIKMPGMSGSELYRRIQKIARSLARRVVFITGDVIGASTTAFLSRTKTPYIAKPFDAEELKRYINRILAERP